MVAAKSSRVNRQYKKKYRIPELEGVRAWPQEPRRRHDLAERGCNCCVGTTEERSSRRPAAVLEPRGPDRVDAAGRLRPTASPDGGVALGLLLPRPSGDIDLALAQRSLQSVEGAEGRTLAGFPSYQSRLGRECKGLPHRCVFEFDVVCVVQQTVADGDGLVRIANDAVPVRDGTLASDELKKPNGSDLRASTEIHGGNGPRTSQTCPRTPVHPHEQLVRVPSRGKVHPPSDCSETRPPGEHSLRNPPALEPWIRSGGGCPQERPR